MNVSPLSAGPVSYSDSALRPQHRPSAVTSFHVEVAEGFTIYVEESGNPNGIPAVFVHGGPGIRFRETDRQWFDPEKYRIICFQERGTYSCTPSAEDFSTNASIFKETTIHQLAEDMEALRRHLRIDKWLVFGGSWGSTLSLYYAEEFPESCSGVVVRGVFLVGDGENRVFYEREQGSRPYLQLHHYALEQGLCITNHRQFFENYRILCVERNDTKACRLWKAYEDFVDNPSDKEAMKCVLANDLETTPEERSIGVWETQLLGGLPQGVDLLDSQRLNRMTCPVKVVQGKLDNLCPYQTAEKLVADLRRLGKTVSFSLIEQGHHTPYSPGMTDALILATDSFAESGNFPL